MKINVPQNFKEALIMSLPNCTTMVLAMMALNLWIYGALTWGHFFAALPRNYIVALTLQVLIAFPLGNYVLGMWQQMRHAKFDLQKQ